MQTEIEFKVGQFTINYDQQQAISSIHVFIREVCNCEMTPEQFMSMNKAFQFVQAEINFSNNQIQLFGVQK